MTTAVFQPRPGLGDMIWHIPAIRALAAAGPVTLIAKRSSQAETLFADDPSVARIVWFERRGREGRGRHDGMAGFARLIADLRALRLQRCVLLHRSASLAAAMALAGIPRRLGYGGAGQSAFLSAGPRIGPGEAFGSVSDEAAAFIRAAGLADALPEPRLAVRAASRARVAARIAAWPPPLAVLGVGSNGADRLWPAGQFAALAQALAHRGYATVALLAAPHEAPIVDAILAEARSGAVRAVLGWTLAEVAALLAEAALFIGNDSGLLNLRAAVGCPGYGLFGASGPLRHSALIRPVVPPGGPRAGMAAITLPQVLAAIGQDKNVLF